MTGVTAGTPEPTRPVPNQVRPSDVLIVGATIKDYVIDGVRKVEDALVDAVLRDQAVELVAARRALDAVVDACDKFGFSCYPSASTDDMPDRAILVADVLAALGVVGNPTADTETPSISKLPGKAVNMLISDELAQQMRTRPDWIGEALE